MSYSTSVISIPKFVGPNKSIKAISHVRSLEILGSTFPIKNTGGTNAADYQLHWEGNDAGFKLFTTLALNPWIPEIQPLLSASITVESHELKKQPAI